MIDDCLRYSVIISATRVECHFSWNMAIRVAPRVALTAGNAESPCHRLGAAPLELVGASFYLHWYRGLTEYLQKLQHLCRWCLVWGSEYHGHSRILRELGKNRVDHLMGGNAYSCPNPIHGIDMVSTANFLCACAPRWHDLTFAPDNIALFTWLDCISGRIFTQGLFKCDSDSIETVNFDLTFIITLFLWLCFHLFCWGSGTWFGGLAMLAEIPLPCKTFPKGVTNIW